MKSTKIRIALAVLAAAFTVGVATVPMASDAQARNNNGRFATSGEAKRQQVSPQQMCGRWQRTFNTATDAADQQAKQGNYTEAGILDDAAADAKRKAGHAGCGWAL
jgi:hypothetical protein